MKLFSRILVSAMAALFAAIGLAFWVAPEQAATYFGFEAMRDAGLVSLRADMGGLFVGLALLCGVGAWAKRRGEAAAAALVLGAIVLGRVVGCIVDGRLAQGLPELTVELLAIAALVVYWRSFDRTEAEQEHRSSHRALKIALVALAVLLLGSGAALLSPAVQQAVFDQAATQLSGRVNDAPMQDDALRVAIAGSSAPLPSAARAKASVVVFAGGRYWVVDSGPESVENLVLWRIPLAKVGGVLLTHFHSDHIGDLGELQLQTWAGGRPAPLEVYGGPGVDGVVAGFNEAYRLDQGYRTAHHGEQVMPSRAWGMVAHTVELNGPPTPAKDRTAIVYQDSTLRITAIEVNHAPIEPAYAYRFDYKGRSVVVSGDLTYHRPLIRGAANADVLVSEAISRSMTHALETAARGKAQSRTAAVMHDVQDYHISPEEAASLANDAKVKLLVYYHLLPAPDGFLPRRLFASGVNKVRPHGWTMADDGDLYTLPLGSKDVQIGRIGR